MPLPLLAALTAATAKRSAGTALRSLVQGAQEVFRLLAEQQLEQAADEHVAAEGLGLTFQLLFRCGFSSIERQLTDEHANVCVLVVGQADFRLGSKRDRANMEDNDSCWYKQLAAAMR